MKTFNYDIDKLVGKILMAVNRIDIYYVTEKFNYV